MLMMMGGTDLSHLHPKRNTNQQQLRCALPEAVVALICSMMMGETDSQFHPIRNTSQQQHRCTLPEAVVALICS